MAATPDDQLLVLYGGRSRGASGGAGAGASTVSLTELGSWDGVRRAAFGCYWWVDDWVGGWVRGGGEAYCSGHSARALSVLLTAPHHHHHHTCSLGLGLADDEPQGKLYVLKPSHTNGAGQMEWVEIIIDMDGQDGVHLAG